MTFENLWKGFSMGKVSFLIGIITIVIGVLSYSADGSDFTGSGTTQESTMTTREQILPAIAITRGPKYHFFGYYDKNQFNKNNRYVLGLEVDFINRSPRPTDVASIGIIDLQNGYRWIKVAETTAWCWQQGAMLQWLPSDPAHKIIYNDRKDGRYVSYIHDVFTGERQMLPMAIYTLSGDGKYALCTDFARPADTRPGYGYNGIPDPNKYVNAPENSGIWRMNLQTGETRLILTIAQMAGFKLTPSMEGAKHWFNHILFNNNSSRFIFLHRWSKDKGKRTRMFTANCDGSDLCLVMDEEMGASHFYWRNKDQIIVWGRLPGKGGRYLLIDDFTRKTEIIGSGILNENGHMTYSPDGKWILTDTYPDKNEVQHLILVDCIKNEKITIARLQSRKGLGEMRCDLHPRFSRDGKFVTVDSIHEGGRQIYLFDLRPIVGY